MNDIFRVAGGGSQIRPKGIAVAPPGTTLPKVASPAPPAAAPVAEGAVTPPAASPAALQPVAAPPTPAPPPQPPTVAPVPSTAPVAASPPPAAPISPPAPTAVEGGINNLRTSQFDYHLFQQGGGRGGSRGLSRDPGADEERAMLAQQRAQEAASKEIRRASNYAVAQEYRKAGRKFSTDFEGNIIPDESAEEFVAKREAKAKEDAVAARKRELSLAEQTAALDLSVVPKPLAESKRAELQVQADTAAESLIGSLPPSDEPFDPASITKDWVPEDPTLIGTRDAYLKAREKLLADDEIIGARKAKEDEILDAKRRQLRLDSGLPEEDAPPTPEDLGETHGKWYKDLEAYNAEAKQFEEEAAAISGAMAGSVDQLRQQEAAAMGSGMTSSAMAQTRAQTAAGIAATEVRMEHAAAELNAKRNALAARKAELDAQIVRINEREKAEREATRMKEAGEQVGGAELPAPGSWKADATLPGARKVAGDEFQIVRPDGAKTVAKKVGDAVEVYDADYATDLSVTPEVGAAPVYMMPKRPGAEDRRKEVERDYPVAPDSPHAHLRPKNQMSDPAQLLQVEKGKKMREDLATIDKAWEEQTRKSRLTPEAAKEAYAPMLKTAEELREERTSAIKTHDEALWTGRIDKGEYQRRVDATRVSLAEKQQEKAMLAADQFRSLRGDLASGKIDVATYRDLAGAVGMNTAPVPPAQQVINDAGLQAAEVEGHTPGDILRARAKAAEAYVAKYGNSDYAMFMPDSARSALLTATNDAARFSQRVADYMEKENYPDVRTAEVELTEEMNWVYDTFEGVGTIGSAATRAVVFGAPSEAMKFAAQVYEIIGEGQGTFWEGWGKKVTEPTLTSHPKGGQDAPEGAERGSMVTVDGADYIVGDGEAVPVYEGKEVTGWRTKTVLIPASTVEANPIYRAGKWWKEAGENMPFIGTNLRTQDEWTETLGQGIGSTVSFFLGSGVGSKAGGMLSKLGGIERVGQKTTFLERLGARTTAGALGMAWGGSTQYDEARAMGAGHGDALLASGLGGLVGLSELAGISGPLNRLLAGKTLQRGTREWLYAVLSEAAEEGAQEGFQTFSSNQIAQFVGYDPDRGDWDGVLQGAAFGALIGGGMTAVTNAYGQRKETKQRWSKASTMDQDIAKAGEDADAEIAKLIGDVPALAAELVAKMAEKGVTVTEADIAAGVEIAGTATPAMDRAAKDARATYDALTAARGKRIEMEGLVTGLNAPRLEDLAAAEAMGIPLPESARRELNAAELALTAREEEMRAHVKKRGEVRARVMEGAKAAAALRVAEEQIQVEEAAIAADVNLTPEQVTEATADFDARRLQIAQSRAALKLSSGKPLTEADTKALSQPLPDGNKAVVEVKDVTVVTDGLRGIIEDLSPGAADYFLPMTETDMKQSLNVGEDAADDAGAEGAAPEAGAGQGTPGDAGAATGDGVKKGWLMRDTQGNEKWIPAEAASSNGTARKILAKMFRDDGKTIKKGALVEEDVPDPSQQPAVGQTGGHAGADDAQLAAVKQTVAKALKRWELAFGADTIVEASAPGTSGIYLLNGKLHIDVDAVAKAAKNTDDGWIEATVEEEIIHEMILRVVGKEKVISMWRALSDEGKAEAIALYDDRDITLIENGTRRTYTEEEKVTDPEYAYQRGQEYLRAIIQGKISKVTEHFHKAKDKGLIRKILLSLKNAYVKLLGTMPEVRSYVTNIEKALKDLKAGKKPDLTSGAGEGAGATSASTPASLDAKHKAFQLLADGQRGRPEKAMLDLQMAYGGGVYPFIAEHVGDLTWRMADRFDRFGGQMEAVEDKVRKTLRTLESRYGFEREKRENEANNGLDPAVVRDLGRKYASAHGRLEVYNDLQEHAKRAAVAVGLHHFSIARKHLGAILESIEDGSYKERVGEFGGSAEGVESPLFAAAPVPKSIAVKLDREPKLIRYRAMAMIDGKLYPPMSTQLEGNLRSPEPVGEWMRSEERLDLVPTKGRNAGKFRLRKSDGEEVWALYAPYFHSSQNPLNDQFSSAYKRPLVTVEVEIPAVDSYQAEGSKRAVGEHPWGGGRMVNLSRYAKIKRVVPDSEVALMIRDTLPKGKKVKDNVVTPSLRKELEKVGVKIEVSGIVPAGQPLAASLPAAYARHAELEAKHNAGTITPEETVEAERLVADAAKRAGYDTKVYHGTDSRGFTEFEVGRKGLRQFMMMEEETVSSGLFFSPSKKDAGGYGRNVMGVFINTKNQLSNPPISSRSSEEDKAKVVKFWDDLEFILEPAIYGEGEARYIDTNNGISRAEVDPDGAWMEKVFYGDEMDWGLLDNPEVVRRMKERGYSSVKVTEDNDASGYSWFVTSPNQIKSAAPFTGVPLSERFDATSDSILRASAPADVEYLAAVEKAEETGAWGKVKAMVAKEARKAGKYPGTWFHGSPSETRIETFDPTKGKSFNGWNAIGTWMTLDEKAARGWANHYRRGEDGTMRESDGMTYSSFVFLKNPLGVDGYDTLTNLWEEITGNPTESATPADVDKFREEIRRRGHDGIIVSNVVGDSPDGADASQTYAIAFDPSQIKSADPVTRDGQGNVIPLSQRFDPGSDSILRSSLPAEVPTGVSRQDASFDGQRVGTARLGTNAKPVATPQASNIGGDIVPLRILTKQMHSIAGASYGHIPTEIISEPDPEAKRVKLIRWMADNLLALHDAFPAEHRARATHWYDGAHLIASGFASKYGISHRQASGIIAVLSPQKDWFMNVAQAEQVLEVWTQHQDTVVGGDLVMSTIEQMVESVVLSQKESAKFRAKSPTKRAKAIAKGRREKFLESKKQKRRDLLESLVGKKINELTDEVKRAWAIRTLAQAFYGQQFQIISPEGEPLRVQTKKAKKGIETPSMSTWGSANEIVKAVRIFQDGSLENISNNLGDEHKVRNFYNNIAAPNSPFGDITADTHAVAAANLMPYGASSKPVSHNFGTGMAGAGVSGISGIYHIYADAYRLAAKERDLQPRQMQSITWEAVRLLFPPESRRDAKVLATAKENWQIDGNEQSRNRIVGQSLPAPSWARTGDGGKSEGGEALLREAGGAGSDVGGGLRFGRGDSVAGTGRGGPVAAAAPGGGEYGAGGQRPPLPQRRLAPNFSTGEDREVKGLAPTEIVHFVGRGYSGEGYDSVRVKTAGAGEEKKSYLAYPNEYAKRAYWGRNGYRVETQHGIDNTRGYKVEVHPSLWYDNVNDPGGLMTGVRERMKEMGASPAESNLRRELYMSAIRDAGFVGFLVPNAAITLVDVPVTGFPTVKSFLDFSKNSGQVPNGESQTETKPFRSTGKTPLASQTPIGPVIGTESNRFRRDPIKEGSKFARTIGDTRRVHPLGAAVEVKDESFYTDPSTRLFMLDDGLGGAAITPYGDLVSVFKHPDAKGPIKPLLEALNGEENLVTLDGYDIGGFLPDLYNKTMGFVPVARVKFNDTFAPDDWPYDKAGRPEIVLMVKNPSVKMDGGYGSIRDEIPLFESWDDASTLRDKYIAGMREGEKGGQPLAASTPQVDSLGFFSTVEKAVLDKLPPKSNFAQLRGVLAKGAKKAEVEWIGINEWAREKGSFTKEEVLEFIDQNRVVLEETVLGESMEIVHDFGDEDGEGTRYTKGSEGDYTLPGGTNPREFLLKLPRVGKRKLTGAEEEELAALNRPVGEMTDTENARAKELLDAKTGKTGDVNYTSGHFDDHANIAVWVRTTDRETADGKRVLHIEEVQSDWAGDIRKKGERSEEEIAILEELQRSVSKTIKDLEKEKGQKLSELDSPPRVYEKNRMEERSKVVADYDAELAPLKNESSDLLTKIANAREGAPPMPFADTYHELALKRTLRRAAEEGYDAITWSTGAQQIDLYSTNLRQNVSRLTYKKNSNDGTVAVTAYGKDTPNGGLPAFSETSIPLEGKSEGPGKLNGKSLNDVVGKNIADKIRADERTGAQKIEGDDLSIGGHFHRQTYDQMIPSFLKKFTKKWGGEVGEEGIDINRKRYVVGSLPDSYVIKDETGPGPSTVKSFSPRNKEQKLLADQEADRLNRATVHALPITPAMREGVSQGQALFASAPEEPAPTAPGDVFILPDEDPTGKKAERLEFLLSLPNLANHTGLNGDREHRRLIVDGKEKLGTSAYQTINRPPSHISIGRGRAHDDVGLLVTDAPLSRDEVERLQVVPVGDAYTDMVKDLLFPGAEIENNGQLYRVTPSPNKKGLRITSFTMDGKTPLGHVGEGSRWIGSDLRKLIGGKVFDYSGDYPRSGATFALTPKDYARHAELEKKHDAGTITPEETAEAERLVADAAKRAGYDVRSRHATGAPEFTEFDRKKIPDYDPDTNVRGFHFSNEATPESSYRYQNSSKNRVMDVFLRIGKKISRRDAQKMVRQGDETDGFPTGYDTVAFLESAGTPTKTQREAYERGEPVEMTNGYSIIRAEGNHLGVDYVGADLFRTNEPGEIITGYDDIDHAFTMHGEEHYVVRSPNQIKSAAPFTGVPLAERFDASKDSILRASIPAPTGGTRDVAGKGIDEAFLEDAYRRGLSVPEKAGVGEARTKAGREARSRYEAIKAMRENDAEVETFAEWERWARNTIRSKGEDRAVDDLIEKGLGRQPFDTAESMMAKILVPRLYKRAAASGSKADMDRANVLAFALDTARRETARSMASFRDPAMTPEERWSNVIASLIAPRNERASMPRSYRTASTPKAKEQKIAELTAELKAAKRDAARTAPGVVEKLERQLKETMARLDKAEIIAHAASTRADKIAAKLAESGVTLAEIFNNEAVVMLRGSKIVARALAKFSNEKRRVIRLAVEGRSNAEIAAEVGMKVHEVALATNAARNHMRGVFKKLVERGYSLRDFMGQDGKQFDLSGVIDEKGNIIAASTPAAGAMTDAEKRVEEMLNAFMQPAAVRNARPVKENGKGARYNPKNANHSRAAAREAYRALHGKVFDMGFEIWINNILSGPQTHFVNLVGNSVNILLDAAFVGPLERMILGKLGQMAGSKEEMNEILQEFDLLKGAFGRAFKNAVGDFEAEDAVWQSEAMGEEEDAASAAQTDKYRQSKAIGERMFSDLVEHSKREKLKKVAGKIDSAASLVARPFSAVANAGVHAVSKVVPGAVGDALANADLNLNPFRGKFIRTPGRMLQFSDTFAKSLVVEYAIGREAYQLAAQDAEELIKKGDLKPADRRAHIKEFMQDQFDTAGSEAMERAMKKATRLAFQEKLRSWRELQKAREDNDPDAPTSFELFLAVPEMIAAGISQSNITTVRYFFPFIKTPFNIFREAFRNSPFAVLPIAAKIARGRSLVRAAANEAPGSPGSELTFWDAYSKEQMSHDFAQLVVGSLITLIAMVAAPGDEDDDTKAILITGAREEDPKRRALTEALYGGPTMIHIRPLGISFNYGRYEPVGAALSSVVDTISGMKRMANGADKSKEAGRIWWYFVNAARQKTFLQGFDAIMDSIEDPSRSIGGLESHLMTYLIPNLIRQPLRNWDPLRRDYNEVGIFATGGEGGLGGAFYQMFPAEGMVGPKTDLVGDPIEKQSNAVLRTVLPVGSRPSKNPVFEMVDKWNRTNPKEAYFPPASEIDSFKDPVTGKTTDMTRDQKRAFDAAWKAEVAAKLRVAVSGADVKRPTPEKIKEVKKIFGDTPEDVRDMMAKTGMFQLPGVAGRR